MFVLPVCQLRKYLQIVEVPRATDIRNAGSSRTLEAARGPTGRGDWAFDYEARVRDPTAVPGALWYFAHELFKTALGRTSTQIIRAGGEDYVSRPKIHVISIGRAGSSFFSALLNEANIPSLFEPFAGSVEGRFILNDADADARALCLYGFGSCNGLVDNELKRKELFDLMQSTAPRVAFKTTRLLNLGVFHKVAKVAREEGKPLDTKFVVLFRDPRAVYSSATKSQGWAYSSVEFVCQALDLQLKTLPRLFAAVGRDNVLPMVFEHWAADLPRTLAELQQFLDLDAMPEDWKKHATDAGPIRDWQTKLGSAEVNEIQTNPACKRYMKKMNYTEGHRTSYANVRREFKDKDDDDQMKHDPIDAKIVGIS